MEIGFAHVMVCITIFTRLKTRYFWFLANSYSPFTEELSYFLKSRGDILW